MSRPAGEITRLLWQVELGSEDARAALVGALHGELVRLAHAQLRHQRRGHTLQPTALAHEAYLRLFREATPRFADRAHFLAAASSAMRSVLVDMARRRATDKRGGGTLRVALTVDPAARDDGAHEVLAVHDAIERLATVDARCAGIVEARFFGGLSVEETAAHLGVSEATVQRDWHRARAWLFKELGP
jgi:RNA polymerase sigma factor (TIGR02999 family)